LPRAENVHLRDNTTGHVPFAVVPEKERKKEEEEMEKKKGEKKRRTKEQNVHRKIFIINFCRLQHQQRESKCQKRRKCKVK